MVSRDSVDRFAAAAETAGAEVVRVSDLNAALSVVARLLEKERTERVAVSASVLAQGFRDELLVSNPCNAQEFAQARVGLVRADFGVAETGTLVHLDSDDNERMLWTLPSTCICLLGQDRIVPNLESLAGLISEHLTRPGLFGHHVSLVTGPSRTADIECELTIGVQGPARLIVILI
jgi:L-lactate dehydrogenase complex protein LldG